MNTDVLIIGSGIAGLSLAIKLAEKDSDLSICIASKTNFLDSNSMLAQGGVAAVMNILEDSLEDHIKDTLKAGDGLCKLEVVKEVVGQGLPRINELIKWGWKPDANSGQKLDLAKEGGHSAHRVVHSKDHTGKTLVEVLMQKVSEYPNIKKLENWLSLDLLMKDGSCLGASFFNQNDSSFKAIQASRTVLATGGTGQVYALTTNPEVATGDGIAMAHRAGARVEFMEFVQFHPTAFYVPHQRGRAFLVSEAVRGHGAILKHADGERFMNLYDERGSLAPRDVVSRAISSEKRRKKVDHVFLDCREMHDFEEAFPSIYKHCIENGINPENQMIPVAPAAHYMCGGINTNLNAETSIPRLFAIGECAFTGLHGANRLASNSLLEALVFAHNCASHLDMNFPKSPAEIMHETPIHVAENKSALDLENVEWEIKKAMSAFVGIVRNDESLMKTKLLLEKLASQISSSSFGKSDVLLYYRCKNLLCIAQLIVQQSLARKNNCGGFYKTDAIKN